MTNFSGWCDRPKDVAKAMQILPFPTFSTVHKSLKGSGKGKTVFLTEYLKQVLGYYPELVQETGDCVSFGAAYAAMFTISTHSIIGKAPCLLDGLISTEDIYGGSRIQIGNGQIRGEGSVGLWAGIYMTKYGVLTRKKYGRYDLTKYQVNRATDWGNRGVPAELLAIAKEKPIKTVSRIETYEEARDAIANGYGISIASNCGFGDLSRVITRDKDGFLRPNGNWAHQMSIGGIDDNSKRPGALVVNSWPKGWINGPRSNFQPEGSFWVDANVLEKYILSAGDSWAFSDFDGFPAKELDIHLV